MSGYRRLTEAELALLGDDELVARIADAREAGDVDGAKAASQVLALGFQDQITIKVARKVPPQDVEDVAQEALVSLISASFDGKVLVSFRAFLNTIVSRRIADYWEAQKRHPPQTPLPSEHGGEDDIWGEEPSVEDSSDELAYRDAIERVLAGLSEVHRRMVVLYGSEMIPGGEDLSGAEVVERLAAEGHEVTVSNVQKVWQRFRLSVAEELAPGEDEGTSDD